MPGAVHVKEVRLQNYKGFSRFTLGVNGSQYLAGPNNAGKSTVLGAIRSAAYLLRIAQSRQPSLSVRDGTVPRLAYRFSPERIGLTDQNVRHEFEQLESRFKVVFTNRTSLTAVWPEPEFDGSDVLDVEPYFFLEHDDFPQPRTPSEIRSLYPSMGVVPTLAPLASREIVLTEAYVREEFDTRLASSHFRNQVYLLGHGRLVVGRGSTSVGTLEEFLAFAKAWLPEIDFRGVEVSAGVGAERPLTATFIEAGRRLPKELAWAGDGVQVWLQILLHVFVMRSHDCIVLDEPELYLHADLQRRLVRLLNSLSPQTVTATHSMEVLAEVDRESITYVDRSRRRAVRAPSDEALSDISSAIGSQFNIGLAKALRSRFVVCVEGTDMRLLTRLARTCGASTLANELGVAVLPLGGFENWDKVEPFKWLLEHFLDRTVDLFVALDRDYRSDDHVTVVEQALAEAGVSGHVWRRKEIENYLVNPAALSRLTGAQEATILEMLRAEADSLKSYTVSQIHETERRRLGVTGGDSSRLLETILTDLDPQWSDDSVRLARVSGKALLSGLNARAVAAGFKTVSARRLASEVRVSELDGELVGWLRSVESRIVSS